jgi:hypothetical protein
LSLNKFDSKQQFGILASANNINQQAFSIQDYLSFSGEMQRMMSGGGGVVETRSALHQVHDDFIGDADHNVLRNVSGSELARCAVRKQRNSVDDACFVVTCDVD